MQAEGLDRLVKRHPGSWILWAASAACVALLIRNPWDLLLIGVVAIVVRWRATGERPGRGTVRLYATVILFPTLLNFAFSRTGDTVLLRLPIGWIGGPYTLEALLFGATAGVQLASLLMVMLAFSTLVTPSDLLRRMPASLAPAGVTASIALTFAPQARRSYAALREAQEVRGYQPRGLRDLPRLVTPLVILSLESALAVGEGLAARGWGRAGLRGWRRASLPAGILLLAAGVGLWSLLPGRSWLGGAAAAAGVLVLLAGLGSAGGQSRYRPDAWRTSDSLVSGMTLGVLVAFAFVAALTPESLAYYPYPTAYWPAVDMPLLAAISLLSMPAWFKPT